MLPNKRSYKELIELWLEAEAELDNEKAEKLQAAYDTDISYNLAEYDEDEEPAIWGPSGKTIQI